MNTSGCSICLVIVFLLKCTTSLLAGTIVKPEPVFEVHVEKSVEVPMRDGIRLSTDLYRPVNAGTELPVVLIRSPYNKNRDRDEMCGHFFAGQGYVTVVQDCLGKHESEGEYLVSAADVEDGYDAITWAATQPWSNGKVGTFGWFFAAGSKVNLRFPPGLSREERVRLRRFFKPTPTSPEVHLRAVWRSLPVIDMMKKADGPPTDFENVVSHEVADPWWDQPGYIGDSDTFDVPALHVNSWYDFGVAETLFLFNLFQQKSDSRLARENQFTIISPTAHCDFENATKRSVVGERNVGDARYDFWGTYVKWFEYWLKGIDSEVSGMPSVQIYVMGKGEWRNEQEWPLKRTEFTKFYFHSNGRANSRVVEMGH